MKTLLRRAALAAACLIFLSCAATREQLKSSPEFRREAIKIAGCSAADTVSSVVMFKRGASEVGFLSFMRPEKNKAAFISIKALIVPWQLESLAKTKAKSEPLPSNDPRKNEWKTAAHIIEGINCGAGLSNLFQLWR